MILDREGPSPNLEELHQRCKAHGWRVGMNYSMAASGDVLAVLTVWTPKRDLVATYADQLIEAAALHLLVLIRWPDE